MKDIKGYEGLYAVTSCGQVWSHRSHKWLKAVVNQDGYYQVHLSKNSKLKWHKVHRLVLEAYNPTNNKALEPNHIDEDKSNNCLNNLEWVTRKENNDHGTRKARAAEACFKPVICIDTGVIYESRNAAAEAVGRSCNALSQAITRGGTCGGYHWADAS